jgi:hypothetical protein
MSQIIEWLGIKMISDGGLTHPGGNHIDSGAYDKEISLFETVLQNVKEKNTPTMIEIGSFWAWWSLMFRTKYPQGENILVEMAKTQLLCGQKNFELNGHGYIPYHAGIGKESSSQKGVTDLGPEISVSQIIEDVNLKSIDVLHIDAQGSESFIIRSISPLLSTGFILNIVVSTHSRDIHNEVLSILSENRYKIVHDIPKVHDDGYIYANLD